MATPMANYVDPESRVWQIISSAIVCGVISTTLMGGRLYVRLKMLRSAGWDDYAATIATVSSRSFPPRNLFVGSVSNCPPIVHTFSELCSFGFGYLSRLRKARLGPQTRSSPECVQGKKNLRQTFHPF